MDIYQQCLYYSKMNLNIGAYYTHLLCDHTERILYVSAKQQRDDGFAIEHDIILLPFIHVRHRNPFLHPYDNGSSDTYTISQN